jgi:hypothetical protein
VFGDGEGAHLLDLAAGLLVAVEREGGLVFGEAEAAEPFGGFEVAVFAFGFVVVVVGIGRLEAGLRYCGLVGDDGMERGAAGG